ncbi:phospholipase D-like domain-containing protein [Sphingomonas flavalba]|uniref:phospholipase D-like domain-containing protein n=1 Tax=Sphingomonas flavalba TaxID=2559804 RepID=UPI00109DC81D|nr:phosphatidylserine/phosphatidylglycerophosphate/cardiolipin synthase family protein [Sphingomonas flavalba]
MGDAATDGDNALIDGNRLQLMTEGPEHMAALIDLIDGAEHSLRLLYYTFAPDHAGLRVRDALMAAAVRGVKVSLLVDGFGSVEACDRNFFAPLADLGAAFCCFIPRFGRRYLLRNHQKMALADDRRVLIGGFNIADDYFLSPAEGGWRDLGLILDGPAAEPLAVYFDRLLEWSQHPHPRLRALRRALKGWQPRHGRVHWLLGGPTRRLNPWARAVKRELQHAHRLDLGTAYFAPNPAMLRRVERIGRRGAARVMTAAWSDNTTTIGAARFCYAGLLRRGVRVFEYQPGKLHTKLMVVEDRAHIGSANFDIRSLYLNMEIMLAVKDAGFADRMRAYFDGELAQCREWTLADVTGWRTLLLRMRWALCYFVVAVLDYNITSRLNFDVDGA